LSIVTMLEFYQGLAFELGKQLKHKKVRISRQVQWAISNLYYEYRVTPVIVPDEIHLVINKILEDLRLLFNFEMDFQNPLILILAG